MPDNNTKTCTGDCLQCSMQQRIYCAAQMTRNMTDTLADINARLKTVEQKVMHDTDAEVFNPISESVIDQAVAQADHPAFDEAQ